MENHPGYSSPVPNEGYQTPSHLVPRQIPVGEHQQEAGGGFNPVNREGDRQWGHAAGYFVEPGPAKIGIAQPAQQQEKSSEWDPRKLAIRKPDGSFFEPNEGRQTPSQVEGTAVSSQGNALDQPSHQDLASWFNGTRAGVSQTYGSAAPQQHQYDPEQRLQSAQAEQQRYDAFAAMVLRKPGKLGRLFGLGPKSVQ